MKDGKRVIFHVSFDGIFFDIISSNFDKLEGYTNIYSVLAGDDLQYINSNHDRLIRVHDVLELDQWFKNPEVDIIYFHGLWPQYFKCCDCIRDGVKTIWFCYGKELYESIPGYSCLIRTRMFKGKSFWFFYKEDLKRFHFFRAVIRNYIPFYDLLKGNTDRRRLISRIDYVQTPLRIEYEMLKRIPYFKAKPFKMDGRGVTPEEDRVVFHESAGGVMINHSAAYSNNFIEVMDVLSHCNLTGRTLYFPIVYGPDRVKELVKKYDGYNGNNTVFIEKKLPLEEYEKLIASCTHAIYGTLRQQALGNIFNCFRTGVKVFLYRNSMNYRQFKQDGFAVFSIEEMDADALATPLTRAEAVRNNRLFYSLYGRPQDYLQTQFDALFD